MLLCCSESTNSSVCLIQFSVQMIQMVTVDLCACSRKYTGSAMMCWFQFFSGCCSVLKVLLGELFKHYFKGCLVSFIGKCCFQSITHNSEWFLLLPVLVPRRIISVGNIGIRRNNIIFPTNIPRTYTCFHTTISNSNTAFQFYSM